MPVLDDFQAEVPPEDQAVWQAQYGNSAPYFWAAQSGRLQVPPEAQGFFNLPADQQDDWYGQYGEGAATTWLQQSQAAAPPPGAGGTGAGGTATAAPPVTKLLNTYQGTYGGQTVRPGDKGAEGIGFGQTVAPSTWNRASPGRNEGWGSIGAGTAGIQYGYGGDWRRPGESIKLYEPDLKHLSDPSLAPGYIPGSATYNQYSLAEEDQKPRFAGAPRGLFQQVAGQTVNSRWGMGGTGDPNNGSELQTPQRYITGNMADSAKAEQGDAAWRARYGGGGGGQMQDPSLPIQYPGPPQMLPQQMPMGGGGMGGGQVNGTGGGENSFFGSTVTSNWGQTAETAGKDYIATLFLRSDTPTGIGTPAYGAPMAFWQGLIEEIRAGRIYVKNPAAWQMLAEKVPGTTPQSIGGAAVGGNNVPPSGGTGAGGTGTGTGTTPNPQFGVGTLAEGTMTPFGPIQGGLPQGVGLEYHRILEDKARREAETALKQAELTGVFNGMPTVAAQELAEKIKQNAFDNAMKTRAEDRLLRQQDLDEAFRQTELKFQKGKATGMVDGEATLELQKFLADQQTEAYKRAADPGRAFENQWARGATGWNNPGVTESTPGLAGVTQPGQSLLDWYKAGGAGQQAAPGNGAVAPTGYQAGVAPMAAPGAPVYGQAQQAAQAAQAQVAGGPQAQVAQYGGPAPQTAQAQAAPQATQMAAQPQAAQMAAQPQAASPQAPQAATQTVNGVTGPAAFLMQTPASVQAFRAGAQMPTAGNYGVANAMLGPDQAALSEADVRRQNLKQTRRMAPSVRALIGSYAKGGSVSDEDFKFYGDRKAPGGATAGASYSMK